jgi:hypothetical protein
MVEIAANTVKATIAAFTASLNGLFYQENDEDIHCR